MRATEAFIPTLREIPAEADTISHQLLLRAGMLRKVAAGIYSILPLGHRVLLKIEGIIREEMNRAGGIELLMPIIQPAEIWQQSGRWDVYGPEMFRLQDRHERSFCLGPTHEELITDLVSQEIKSYRQLPLMLYQIQNKYRDERRPRFGLLRGREFIMKDLYSFDIDEQGLDASYAKMYAAYSRIFERCGLSFRVVEADPGAIGGGDTHEFMVMADTGEAEIVFCAACDYAADIEKAACPVKGQPTALEAQPLERLRTPGTRTVDEVAKYLNVPASQVLKILLYLADGEPVAVLIRGDRSANEVKVQNYLQAIRLEIADAGDVAAKFGLPPGFAGPVGLQGRVRVLADNEVRRLVNGVAGANEPDHHYRNVNYGRDYQVDAFGDFRIAQQGDACPRCGQPVQLKRGIEVGQLFKLGTKYSKVLGATILDEGGKEVPVVMGCYGIGVTRTLAAAVEQWHDKDGIVWPYSIAPYEVVIIPVSQRDALQTNLAEALYQQLLASGIDAIYDDRTERTGVKFKDADLIGYPVRIVINEGSVIDRLVEVKWRDSGIVERIPHEDLCAYLCSKLVSNNCSVSVAERTAF
ncbi:MAG: proline--tRNA ligase [Thermacetogeniaceae bacterium]